MLVLHNNTPPDLFSVFSYAFKFLHYQNVNFIF